MNLTVTDAMHEFRLTPAIALGHQMMTVGLRGRDLAVAKWTHHTGAWRPVHVQSSRRDGLSWGVARLCSAATAALESSEVPF